MSKKVYVNVFESPYVDMANDYKIYRKEEPLPNHIIYLEKEAESGIADVTQLLANEISKYSMNDIVRSYEGQKNIYIDILIPPQCDIESIRHTINKCTIFTSKSIDSKRHNYNGIIKLLNPENLDYDGLEKYNHSKVFSYTYEFANLGATGMEFSLVEFINGSFMVILAFIFQFLFKRFFRFEPKGSDGNKYLRYYNEKKIVRQLRKRTNKQIKSYEFINHRIRKKEVGLLVEMRSKKSIYVIKTNALSGIDKIKIYKANDYIVNR